MSKSEIGSEFGLNSIVNKTTGAHFDWLLKYNNIALTSSGRGAITLLLQQIQPKKKSVLLPAYICESVILPFVELGYECNYYEVNEDLVPNIKSINSFKDIGVFFHMGYYGFPTNSNLENVLKSLKLESTLIVEDVTHTLFTSHDKSELNDYYVCSIRKWFGIPSGGFLASNNKLNKNISEENFVFSNKRLEAFKNKDEYLKTHEFDLKEIFLRQFSEAESWLNKNFLPYRIDSLSLDIINTLNAEDLVNKRKENYKTLSDGLKNIDYLQPLFRDIDEKICPMFFPILLKEKRNRVRNILAKQGIYCPIHWPLPEQVDIDELTSTLSIYNSILSIPCDQRYGREDMERIISIINSI